MHSANQDIAEILNACMQQKRDAQKALYKKYHAYCLSITLRYAESREDAVEMMNDGFLKIFTYIKTFDFERPFRPWMRRIIINSTLDHLKKHQRKLEEIEMEAGLRELVQATQEDHMNYEEMLEMVRELPTAYRTVFNLHAIEGYKHEEIAEMLGINVGTSKSNYFKAKQKLQVQLKKYFGVEQK